jgi:hypothetical protein
MDTQDQMQAIVDRLVGAPPETLPRAFDLDDPWRTIYLRTARVGEWGEAESLIWKATRDFEDQYHLARALVDLLPSADAFTAYPSLHEMSGQFPSVDWLWPSWIPRGMVTLFGAAPGAGKSLVALDLARRIIHGQPFPDGAPVLCPGSNVLIVDAEGAPTLLNQRARAWEIDRRRLFLMLAPDASGLVDLDHPDQQDRLSEMCRTLEPALVVVDSLAAATARGETSLQGARDLLGFLSALARREDFALLVIHHLRKRARSGAAAPSLRVAADDLRGSTHLSAAARSVLALSWVGAPAAAPFAPPAGAPSAAGTVPLAPSSDPAAPSAPSGPRAHTPFDGPRRLEVVKTNLCRHPPPLGLVFEGENLAVPVLRYTELVEPPPQPTHVDLCARWLFQYLDDAAEPVKPADVVRAATQAGFPRHTLYRARQALAGWVVDLGTGPRDPRKRWALAQPPASPPITGGHPVSAEGASG